MARTAAQTREHVLAVAHELFYWRGIRATGVDTVAAEAGVAPTTLYRLFSSKDGLIAAYIERADAGYRDWFDAAVASAGGDPRAGVLALFDALAQQVRPERCRGCPFLMALAEFPDPDHPAHRAAVAMKAHVRHRLGELAATTGAADPDALADHLALLMEGVYASVQALGTAGPVHRARTLAEAVLAAHRPATR